MMSPSLTLMNILVLALTAIPFIYLSFFGVPVQRGFYCDDESLSYPYHPSTIPTYALYITGFGFPFIVILLTEATLGKLINDYVLLIPYLRSVLKACIDFGFGAGVSQCFTDIAKYSIGRLRPHFFDVCRPDFENLDCSTRSYISNYTCMGNPELFHSPEEIKTRVNDAHLSFFSGHASFSCQSVTFIILYLHARTRGRREGLLLVPLIQLSFGIFAFYTSLSRVADYKHHPTDVIAGAIFGVLAQVLNVFFVTDLFRGSLSGSSREPLVESLAMRNDEAQRN
eukprot:TRINITY_DN6563_c0_g1_i1.p1 TRINITY_DN6563_c0_g1~~TRINITY_DN6563_c0_g1_i1.p1  ORF type:complete len:283 (-),score=49.21 TRINITY_DN6563_c0_g1_i1:736-1584(-)